MRTAVRTGWRSKHRRCPLHGEPLELWLDETDYGSSSPRDRRRSVWDRDENRIGWRCETCLGAWLENHFFEPPHPAPVARLIVTCPACGSRRVSHTCVAACCTEHGCLDCRARFEVRARLLRPGAPLAERRAPPPRRATPWATADLSEVVERSGVTRPFRRCPTEDTALELVFVEFVESDPTEPPWLGWLCPTCSSVWSEAFFRAWHPHWVPEVKAAVACPTCHDEDVRPADSGYACAACGAAMSIEVGDWKRPA